MKTLTTLYHLLGVRHKIADPDLRILYLKNVWGCDQATIAECEKSSQPMISRQLSKAKLKFSERDIENLAVLSFSVEELKYVQSLPRNVLPDAQLISFIHDILKINISHPFYSAFGHGDNIKITALSQLGIMNKRIEKIYNKTQAGVSMIIKRNLERAAQIERPMRYDLESSVYTIEPITKTTQASDKFTLAGGQNG